MSANNQTLVKQFQGRWYVFKNIMAESWEEKKGYANTVNVKEAVGGSYITRALALEAAHDLEAHDPTEYGVHEHLAKDGANVEVVK